MSRWPRPTESSSTRPEIFTALPSNAGGLNTCGINQPCGTIYKAAPNGSGGYTFSLLYEFPGETANGFWPYAALNIDSAGNIYGSTGNGGNLSCGISGGCGVVFQIIP